MAEPLVILSFPDSATMEAHLAGRGSADAGFWLKVARKGAPVPTIGKQEAIAAALCHGWIDGQLDRHDEHHFLIRITPRRAGSRWSAINRDTAVRLIGEGRMKAGGLKEVERAKADGRWDAAYRSQAKAEPPAGLLAALAENPVAERMFTALDGANRYAIIYRVNDARRPETRARRIADYVAMLARGETIHPVGKKPAR